MRAFRDVVAYMGFGFYWAWIFVSFNSAGSLGQNLPIDALTSSHLVSSVAAILPLLAAFLLRGKIEALSHRALFALVVSSSVLASVSTACMQVFFAQPIVYELATASSGLFVVGPMLAWGVVYGSLDAKNAVVCTALSFALAALIYFVVSFVPGPVAALIATMLPLAAGLGACACLFGNSNGASRRESGISQGSSIRASVSVGTLIGLAVVTFVYGGLRVYSVHASAEFSGPSVLFVSVVIASAIMLLYMLLIPRTSLNLGVLYRVALIAFAAVLMLAAVGEEVAAIPLEALVRCGMMLFEILTWVLLAETVRTGNVSALAVFSAGRLAVHVGISLGEGSALVFGASSLEFLVCAVIALIVAAGFLFRDADTTFFFASPTEDELRRITRKRSSIEEEPSGAEGALEACASDAAVEAGGDSDARVGDMLKQSLEDRIDSVASRYGFSAREREVFELWVTGHDAQYIQDELVISRSTVKTHVRHIYEKCDVHSRSDLMRVLERD